MYDELLCSDHASKADHSTRPPAGRGFRTRIERRALQDRELLTALLVHDMRQPLHAVQSFLQIVLAERTGPLNERQRDFLETANNAIGRLAVLVEDFEQLVADSPTLMFSPQPVDLPEQVMACVAELQPQASSRDIELRIERYGEGPWWITADPLRLAQILLNLLENAIRYSNPESVVRVRLRATRSRVLCLAENETALTRRDPIESWYEPGRRYEPSAGAEPGRGLGLGVVSYLVDAHAWRRIGRVRDGIVSIGFTLSR